MIGVAPAKFNLLLALAVGMNAAIVLGSTTSGGLLVEAGQRFNASGRLSSLRVFAQNLGAALGTLLGGLLAAYALVWTSAVAMLPLLCMFFAAWLLLREPPVPPAAEHGRSFFAQLAHVALSVGQQIRNVLRWQMLLPGLLLFFIQAVPTFRSTCLYQYQTKTLNYTDAALGWLGLAGYGAALLSSGVYAWWCRKVPLRMSLYGAIILTYFSALPYLFYNASMPRALAIESVGHLPAIPCLPALVRSGRALHAQRQ